MQAINGAYVGYPTDYTLDAQGRRVRSFVMSNNVATDFVYDAEGHLLGEYWASGGPIQEFVWLGDTPVAVMGGSAGTGTVDNTSSQVLVTGTWPQTQSSAAQGGNYRSHAAGSGAASFTWTLNPHAADYQVYARWMAGTDRASNATYQVTHAAGVSPVPADQRVNGSQWVLLGTFRFAFGTGHGVTLTDAADGVVVADAIRILPAGPILSYVYADHLDTPRLLTDDTGRARWRWLADPFGTVLPETNPEAMGPFTFNLRFPGQRFDWETGLHYNVFRDYDPGTGRYVESDPIGLAGGISLYPYADLNPISKKDPLGLSPWGSGGSGGSNGNSCCQQSYLDYLANCIRRHDPLGDPGKAGLTGLGGTFPKSWIGQPTVLGSSPLTTVPSAAAFATGGGSAGTIGAVARGAGRVFSPIWVSYGLYLAGMELYCAAACSQDNCAY